MSTSEVQLGLRLLELETGFSKNLDDSNSPEMVEYESTRLAGQTARLAMLVKGQDIVEDELLLKKLVAYELGISPAEYREVKRALQELDLLEEIETRTGKRVLREKVERLNHAENYRRVGGLWIAAKERTAKEEALVHTLDRLVASPAGLAELDTLGNLGKLEQAAVLELGSNAGVIDKLDVSDLYFTPLLWEVDPKKLSKFLRVADKSAVKGLLQRLRERPGSDFTDEKDQIVSQAISAGILPSYRVRGTGGPRLYSFAPYSGALLTSDTEKTILDKARALVSSLRYGSEAATITKIRSGRWIIKALMNSSRGHRVGPHSELKGQYGMLVAKRLGNVIPDGHGRYYFELIPTPDNLRACQIALELLTEGEIMGAKDPAAVAAVHLGTAVVNHPLEEVKVARKKRAPRADELAAIIDSLRSFD